MDLGPGCWDEGLGWIRRPQQHECLCDASPVLIFSICHLLSCGSSSPAAVFGSTLRLWRMFLITASGCICCGLGFRKLRVVEFWGENGRNPFHGMIDSADPALVSKPKKNWR